jgi:hypothetical protein
MEFAIPFIALAGAYVISNQENKNLQNSQKAQNIRLKNGLKTISKEEFTNMGKNNNYLPNQYIPPQNFPITNVSELTDTTHKYDNPNAATDKYFNQNYFENKNIRGENTGNQIQEIYSLNGNYLNSKEFKHNNMVPFNNGKIKGQVYQMDISETILDNMNGVGSQTIQKIEQAPLFKPEKDINWAHGMPNWSDFYQSRVNPAMNNANVKPFDSLYVGPGLGKGYTTKGSGGYNSGMENQDLWLPKTVDELRVETNPKLEYTYDNLEGPASAPVKNVGIVGKTEKYRPDTFFIQTQDRWLTTTGQEQGQMLRPIEEVSSDTNRNSISTSYSGVPNNLKTASYITPNIRPAKKVAIPTHSLSHGRSIGKGNGVDDKETFLNSITNYENNRSSINQPDTFRSSFTHAIGAVVSPIMDILRPTRKEEYGDNLRIYGLSGSNVPHSYINPPGNNAPITIKETTLFTPDNYIGNQSYSQQVLHNQQPPLANQRDSTNCSYIGSAESINNAQMSYDSNYNQNNNDKLEAVQVSYTPHGGTQLFNQHMNVSMSRLDTDRENIRQWGDPKSIISQSSYPENISPIKGKQCYKENDINVVRIQPDILNAFKSNPYTQSLSSYATI